MDPCQGSVQSQSSPVLLQVFAPPCSASRRQSKTSVERNRTIDERCIYFRYRSESADNIRLHSQDGGSSRWGQTRRPTWICRWRICTGEISAKKWDIADEELPGLEKIKEGGVIKVKALVTERNGMKQLRVTRIRQTSAEDNLDMKDYIKAAPENAADMYDFIYSRAAAFQDEDLRKICIRQLEDNEDKLSVLPGSPEEPPCRTGGSAVPHQEDADDGRESMRGIYESEP